MPAWQVPRTCSGWMQLYKELAHYNVQAVPWFKAAHQCFLLMWIQPPAASPLRFDSIEGRCLRLGVASGSRRVRG